MQPSEENNRFVSVNQIVYQQKITRTMKRLLAALIVLTTIYSSNATHIVGGDISLQYVSPNTYNLTVRVYKDCGSSVNPNPAGMPTSVTVGLYDLSTDAQNNTWILNNQSADTLSLGDACYTPDDICVMEGIFSAQVTIPNNVNGWYLSTQLYARNGIIDNIVGPGSTGMTFYAEIPDPAIGVNSTPDFGPYPTDGYLCISYRKELEFNVSDADGDSLVYSLVDPLGSVGTANGTFAGPYTGVNWLAPFSLADICGGTPPMDIDPVTGIVSAQPTTLGVYVLSVRVEEYRNGIKIGETRRDMQYAALNCTVDSPPNFLGWDDTIQTVEALSEICFDFIVQDVDADDTIYMDIDSDILSMHGGFTTTGTLVATSPDSLYEYEYTSGGSTFNVQQDQNGVYLSPSNNVLYFNEGTVAQRFCWTPQCEHIRTAPYPVNVESYSLGCSGSDTTRLGLEVNVVPIQNGFEKIPNVFTPNGDGVNDYFTIDGRYDQCNDFMNVKIMNRWGQLIFESDDPLFKWDGKTSSGKDCNPGTYYVLIEGQYGGESITNDDVGNQDSRSISKYAVSLFR